jgi:hypothetical protein
MNGWTKDPRTGFLIRSSGSAPDEPQKPRTDPGDVGQGALRGSGELTLDDLTNHQVWLANRAAAVEITEYNQPL